MASCQTLMKKAGSVSVGQWYGSADPDPYQTVMDPQHCCSLGLFCNPNLKLCFCSAETETADCYARWRRVGYSLSLLTRLVL
jgi:hypothetical protein